MLNQFKSEFLNQFFLILGCGVSLAKQTAQRRIVGGDDAGFGSFPWQAYIRIGSSRYDFISLEFHKFEHKILNFLETSFNFIFEIKNLRFKLVAALRL